MKWVKASERLPEEGLVTWRWIDNEAAYSGYSKKKGFYYNVGGASVDPLYYGEIEWLDESASTESEALGFVNEMCIESLSPETFEAWEVVKAELKENRKVLREFKAASPSIDPEDVRELVKALKEIASGTDYPLTVSIAALQTFKTKYPQI